MSAQYFFDNQTLYDYKLVNNDGYNYTCITSKLRFYSVNLPFDARQPPDPYVGVTLYSYRTYTLYNKKNKNKSILFNIDGNGIIDAYIISPDSATDGVKVAITTVRTIYVPAD